MAIKTIIDRVPLANGKNVKIRMNALNAATTWEQFRDALIASGLLADIIANNALTGGDVGVSSVGDLIGKGVLESLAWQGLDEYHVPTISEDTGSISVSATSEHTTSSQAYLAFDGNPSTRWLSSGIPATTPQRLSIHFPYAITAKEMKFLFYSANTNYAPTNFTIGGSNDGTNWTTLHTYNGVALTGEQTINISSNTTAYSYYSINTTGVGGSTTYGIMVYSMQITKVGINTLSINTNIIPSMNDYTLTGYVMDLGIPLTEYAINKRVMIRVDTPTVESVKLGSMKNPYLNINNLGIRLINDTLNDGETYELVYNGGTWEAINSIEVITGTMSVTATIQTVTLGFKPKLVIAYNALNDDDDVTVGATGHTYKSFPRVLTQAYNDSTNGEIIDTGFTYKGSTTGTVYYIALR